MRIAAYAKSGAATSETDGGEDDVDDALHDERRP